VITDGRATAGAGAVQRSLQAAAQLASTGLNSVVIDCETGAVRLGLARQLAVALNAEHLDLGEVAAASLTAAVRERTGDTSRRGRAA